MKYRIDKQPYRRPVRCTFSAYISYPPLKSWYSINDYEPEDYEDCRVASYHTCPECETKLSGEEQRYQQYSNCDWSA